MLNAQQSQTVPAVPIAMKKAQENVAGSMGSNAGAPGPMVSPPKDEPQTTLKKPKKKFPLKYIIGGIVLLLLLIGAGAGFYLTQISQDVRQQAAEFAGDPYSCVDGSACPSGYSCNRTTDRCVEICDNTTGTAYSVADGGRCCGGGVIECQSGSCSGDTNRYGTCNATTTGGGEEIVGGGDLAGPLESCETKACQEGLVCQGQAGSRVCQDFGSDQCPGGACTGYYSFQCDSLYTTSGSNGQLVCESNPQFHDDRAEAIDRASATGCGQWDQVCVGGSNNGNLCGDFSIINQSCDTTGTGGNGTPTPTATATPTPTPSPTTAASPSPTPDLALCNEACSVDTDCAQSDHSCVDQVCRLTTNPASVTCQEVVPVGCGDPCSVSTDCAEANHICLESANDGNPDGGICRLINNPNSETCVEPTPAPSPTPTVGCNDACVTSADCADTDHSCSAETNTCRLTINPGDENCAPPPSPSPTPAPGCNEECYSSSECSNSSAICYDNLCRLSTNPTDTACQPRVTTQTTGQYYEQPNLPTALPESGSEDILNWLKVGLGALGLGLIFLFL